jgi:putative transposase
MNGRSKLLGGIDITISTAQLGPPHEPDGLRELGSERIRRVSPYRRAKSFEPIRGRNPTFAVGRGQRQAFFAAVADLRAFRRAYRDALERWRAGLRQTVFPLGTWAMRCMHAAPVDTG